MANHDTHNHAGVTGVPSLTAPNPTTIELGHASDTTLARVSAGVVSIEGTNIVKAGAATGSGLTMATARILGRTTAATGAIEEITVGSGLSLSAGSLTATGSSSFTGFPAIIVPQGCAIASPATPGATQTNATGQIARTATVIIPASMRLRSLWINVTSAGAGSLLWGLYDVSTNAAAATEAATGTAAPGGTGWREIAATGAPVVIAPGNYCLNIMNPLTNPSTIATNLLIAGAASMLFRAWGTHTWDTTPDMTSASWTDSSLFYHCFLEGEIDGSGSRL